MRPIRSALSDDTDIQLALVYLMQGERLPLDVAAKLLARGFDVAGLERKHGV